MFVNVPTFLLELVTDHSTLRKYFPQVLNQNGESRSDLNSLRLLKFMLLRGIGLFCTMDDIVSAKGIPMCY